MAGGMGRRRWRQSNLFVAPAQPHSATSVEAADRIAPSADTLRARLLAWLQARGLEGATDEEMQDGLPMASSTQRPRRVELVRLGKIADSGTVRKTRAGRNATVWVATAPVPIRAKESGE